MKLYIIKGEIIQGTYVVDVGIFQLPMKGCSSLLIVPQDRIWYLLLIVSFVGNLKVCRRPPHPHLLPTGIASCEVLIRLSAKVAGGVRLSQVRKARGTMRSFPD